MTPNLVNIVDPNTELISTLKTLGITLCVHTIYQAIMFDIRDLHCRFKDLYWNEIIMQLKDFQLRGI